MSLHVAVFWIDAAGAAQCQTFASATQADPINAALSAMQALRTQGMHHVCMSTENDHQVGSKGVAAVEQGKLPDGSDYSWSKSHRAGASRRSSGNGRA